MYGYVYLTRNLTNGKSYIGRRTGKFDSDYIGSGVVLTRAIEKYGKENFEVSILERCDSKKDLEIREEFYIEKFNAVDDKSFYNVSPCSSGGNIFGVLEEDRLSKIKNKMSKSAKNRKKIKCPACGKVCSSSQAKRWHFDNCKPEKYKKNESKNLYKKEVRACLICGKESPSMKNHLRKDHDISLQKYYDRYIKKDDNEGICHCGNSTKFLRLNDGYRKFCSTKCSNSNAAVKLKKVKTCLKRHGVENPSKSPIIKDKKKKTIFDNFGVVNAGQVKNSEVMKCPHCHKVGKSGGMKRWHFNNCKKVQELNDPRIITHKV